MHTEDPISKSRNALLLILLLSVLLGASFALVGSIPEMLWLVYRKANLGLSFGFEGKVAVVLIALAAVVIGGGIGLACSPIAVLLLRRKPLKHVLKKALLVGPPVALLPGLTCVFFQTSLSPAYYVIALAAGVSFLIFFGITVPRIPNIAVPGYCRTCDYCLEGNMSGVCPECGTSIDSGRRAGAETDRNSENETCDD